MDLCIDLAEHKLNIRAGAIIIHNNKVLMHTNVDKGTYHIIGGRVEAGEASSNTVEREVKEEIGKDIKVQGHIATIENFFSMNNKKYHEIMFLHKAEFVDDEDRKIQTTLNNIEGKDYLKYEWVDLDNIDEYEILPNCVVDILKNNIHHVINNELI